MSIPTPLRPILGSLVVCVLNVVVFPEVLPNTEVATLFLGVTVVFFGLYTFWAVSIYPRFQSPLRHLPNANKGASPVVGHRVVTFRGNAGDLFLKFMNEIPNDGLIRFPGIFNENMLLLTGLNTLAEVLVTKSYEFEKESAVRKFLRIILGDGLILVEGDEHKFQRKHASPAFSFRHIKELYPIFWSKAVDLVQCVSAEVHANPLPIQEEKSTQTEAIVEVNHWANKVTMDIIGVAGLGREFNTLHTSDDELINNYEEILEPTTEKAIFFGVNLIFPRRLIAMLPWKLNQRLNDTTEALRGLCRQLVRDKKQRQTSEKDSMVDILSLLIKSNNFADEMLVDQLLTFLAAGHETTSSAFTWGSWLLAAHPEIQSQLREEIRANLPSPSAPLDPKFDLAGTLENLPLLSAVCNEILRLYPPVPITTRVSVKPTTLAGNPVPAGTRIFISPWAINRSPHLWGPTAPDFQPSRWIDSETGKANNHGGVTSNYSILTFLHGPRSCIGERFAKSELKALVAVFVGSLEMRVREGEEGVVPIRAGAITTKPRDGMRLRVRKVEGW